MADIIYTAIYIFAFLFTGVSAAFFINKRMPQDSFLNLLNLLILSLSLPALLFLMLFKFFSQNGIVEDFFLTGLYTLIVLSSAILSVFILKFTVKKNDFKTAALMLLFPNVFVFPLILIYGELGLNHSCAFVFALFSIFFIPVGFVSSTLVKKRDAFIKGAKRRFLPLIFSQLVGLIFAAFSFQERLPWFVTAQVETLALLTLPLFMLFLGASLLRAFKFLGKENYQSIFIFILLKQVLMPLVVFIFIYVFNVEYRFGAVMILLSSSPASSMISSAGEEKLEAQLFFWSTAATVILMPLSFNLLGKLY
ncbi:MAG: AEC family transporter [bacterium]|nr:AEC family transporter [bacterium]